MLPSIFFAVSSAWAWAPCRKPPASRWWRVFQGISEAMFKVTHMIMNYAPIGVFALIAVTVANFGFASLLPLAKLVVLVYVVHRLLRPRRAGPGGQAVRLLDLPHHPHLKDELILAYSTASSETVLPRIIEKMEAYGAPSPSPLRGAHRLFLQPGRLHPLPEHRGAVHRPSSMASTFAEPAAAAGADPDGHLQGIAACRRVLRVLLATRAASAFRWKAWPSSPVWIASWTWRAPP